jgi:tetratricopeptide (TPR) repeat protein
LLRIEASINVVAEQQEEQGNVTVEVKRRALESVADELTKLRGKNPNNVDIRILQATIASYLDDPNTAEQELQLAIDECEESLNAEMQLSRFYSRSKRIDEAISTSQSACDNHPEIAEPWLFLSELYIAKEDYDAARSCLKQAQEVVVGKWEKRSVLMSLALLELTHGEDRASGISILDEIAAQDKREVRARTLLLGIREVQEDQAKVQQLIEELQKAEGESGLMWRLYESAMWLSSDEWRSKQQDISAHLQYCIDSDPKWSYPPLLLAEMYVKLQDTGRVENIYRQALTRNPSATDIVDRLVTLLEKQGRFSDAEQVLKQSETNSRFSRARQTLLSLRAGEFSRAIDELKLRISNNEKDANSRILLARLIYWQNQDRDQALRYLDEAEAITSGNLAVTAARVSILRAEGQTEEAQRILNDYVANTDVFGAYMIRATYFANQGDFERAEQDYRKLTTFTEQGAIGYELLSNFFGRSEKFDKAVEVLEEGLNAYPEDLRLKRRLMKILFLSGPVQDRQRALEMLAALEEQLPQDPELMKFRALHILEEAAPQSREAAREILENVVKLEPTAVDAHLILIDIAMQEQDYEIARDSAIRAIGSNPDNLLLLSARGKAELALKNTQIAAQLAHVVLQRDPNNIEAMNVLVASALDSKNRSLLEEARTLIESALGGNFNEEKLLITRARVLAAMDMPRSAIPELEAYCQTKEGGNSVDAIVTLAEQYRLSGDMEKAGQRIKQAEQINPNSLKVIHARFVWLAAQNRFEELEGISNAYISATEQNPDTFVEVAGVLSSLDSMTLKKEGIKLFEHAVKLAPTLKSARLGLANSLYQTGDSERAEKIYQELLKQYPNDVQILNDLAWILQEHFQRYTDALELANKALRIAPSDLFVLDTRGTILLNIPGRLTDAKNDFERLIELSSPDTHQRAQAHLQLSRICVKLNEPDQARQHANKALEIDKKIDVFTPDERSEISRILQ